MDGGVHFRISGEGPPLVLLPPAPHTGAFYETLIPYLDGYLSIAADYPGYGGSTAIPDPTIETYAEALAPNLPLKPVLIGFHTGNLVAAELCKRVEIAGILMIDIPYFNLQTRQSYAVKMEHSPRNAAFHAAFAYDPQTGLNSLPCPVHCIATQSSLLDLTRDAAKDMDVPLTERMDVRAPVFENHTKVMAKTIQTAIRGLR